MQKPDFDLPTETPESLVIDDFMEGDGAAAKPGDVVHVHYIGRALSTGTEFDNSYDRGAPLAFPLGCGRVIPGWDEGLLGMKVGGRRRLTIPADLAYGPRGIPGVIAPNETLVFLCDLVDIR